MNLKILPIRLLSPKRSCEISQQGNVNAITRIWIEPHETVYKEYVLRNNIYRKNVHNLLKISSRSAMYSIPEIAMPISIYKKGLHIQGYTMKHYSGISIRDFLTDECVDSTMQLRCLIKLGSVICQLPEDIFIGDLHGENVLVEEDGNIHIIDIDGFSTSRCEITCPLSVQINSIPKNKKYFHCNGKFKISRESDIFCFYLLFLTWLSKEDAFRWSKFKISEYLAYLEYLDFPKSICSKIYNLYSEKRNNIDIDELHSCSNEIINKHGCTATLNIYQVTINVKEKQKMSLRDRVKELDTPESFEDRANKVAEAEVASMIRMIEDKIKKKQYDTLKRKKQVQQFMYTDICYSVGNDVHYSDSPHYYGGSSSSYTVNNEREAWYLINAIKSRLEKEGCVCKVESRSYTSSNGIGFLDSIFKGSTTRYTYSISCIFEWTN